MDEIDLFLQEDFGGRGDITSNALFAQEKGKATIFANQGGILAGATEARLVFENLNCEVILFKKDGERIEKGSKISEVKGPIKSILGGERLALNFLGRMSGIATQTRQMMEKCRKINPKVKIAGTRKTTPGFRRWEKKAIQIGGGEPHRMGLWDGVLIKDNHIIAIGSIERAIRLAKEKIKDKPIEVEVTSLEEAKVASELEIDAIMLDNISPSKGAKIAQAIRQTNPEILIEVSGGINPENVASYASYPDRISCGCLTHSAKGLDFSLEVIGKVS